MTVTLTFDSVSLLSLFDKNIMVHEDLLIYK